MVDTEEASVLVMSAVERLQVFQSRFCLCPLETPRRGLPGGGLRSGGAEEKHCCCCASQSVSTPETANFLVSGDEQALFLT